MNRISENELGDRMMTGLPYGQGGGIGMASLSAISSPDINQLPNKFLYPNNMNNKLDIRTPAPDEYEDTPPNNDVNFDSDVRSIKSVVNPDEIITGMQYVLKRMPFKNRDLAKQIVVQCLKKNTKYFSSLNMIGIDDNNTFIDDMINESFYTKEEKQISTIFKKLKEDKLNKRKY